MMCPQFLRLHLQFARACNQRGKIHSKAKEIKKVPSDLQNIHRCSCDGFCTHWCSAPPGGLGAAYGAFAGSLFMADSSPNNAECNMWSYRACGVAAGCERDHGVEVHMELLWILMALLSEYRWTVIFYRCILLSKYLIAVYYEVHHVELWKQHGCTVACHN
ncbi:unnamed protein product [Urochloa humidicola]